MATLLPKFTGKLYAKATATPYLTVADNLYAKGVEMVMPYLTATGKPYAKGAATATPHLTVADKPYAKGAEMVMPYLTATERHSSQVVG